MISIPYGKLFYLQAACQTKQQKQKSSSALGRNKILKNKVRTQRFGAGGVSPFQTSMRTGLLHRMGCGLGEQGGGAGVQEGREETVGRCTKHL